MSANMNNSIEIYRLKNNKGMSMSVLNYGGSVSELLVPDHHGNRGDVFLGFDHELMICAQGVTVVDEMLSPTGDLSGVLDSVFDFRKGKIKKSSRTI